MNTIQKLIVGICLLSAPFIGSCGKDNDPDPCNYTTELQAEVDAYIAALTAYSQDQSMANCIAYKNSLTAYLNAADDVSNCVPANQQAQFQASLDAALADANALPCQ
ncbi:MAG: hypothetical protein ABIQ11_06280 [Saprospiraceae bacterium]